MGEMEESYQISVGFVALFPPLTVGYIRIHFTYQSSNLRYLKPYLHYPWFLQTKICNLIFKCEEGATEKRYLPLFRILRFLYFFCGWRPLITVFYSLGWSETTIRLVQAFIKIKYIDLVNEIRASTHEYDEKA